MPRGELLPLEIVLRGYRLYATRLSYWDRVEAHAAAASVSLAPPVEVRVPNLRFTAVVPLSCFDAGDTVHIRDLRVFRHRWTETWSARPTLIGSHLRGDVRETIDQTAITGI